MEKLHELNLQEVKVQKLSLKTLFIQEMEKIEGGSCNGWTWGGIVFAAVAGGIMGGPGGAVFVGGAAISALAC